MNVFQQHYKHLNDFKMHFFKRNNIRECDLVLVNTRAVSSVHFVPQLSPHSAVIAV